VQQKVALAYTMSTPSLALVALFAIDAAAFAVRRPCAMAAHMLSLVPTLMYFVVWLIRFRYVPSASSVASHTLAHLLLVLTIAITPFTSSWIGAPGCAGTVGPYLAVAFAMNVFGTVMHHVSRTPWIHGVEGVANVALVTIATLLLPLAPDHCFVSTRSHLAIHAAFQVTNVVALTRGRMSDMGGDDAMYASSRISIATERAGSWCATIFSQAFLLLDLGGEASKPLAITSMAMLMPVMLLAALWGESRPAPTLERERLPALPWDLPLEASTFQPARHFLPRTEEDVVAALRTTSGRVVVSGAGTSLSPHVAGAENVLLIDTSELRGMQLLAGGVLEVGAGVGAGEVDAFLRPRGFSVRTPAHSVALGTIAAMVSMNGNEAASEIQGVRLVDASGAARWWTPQGDGADAFGAVAASHGVCGVVVALRMRVAPLRACPWRSLPAPGSLEGAVRLHAARAARLVTVDALGGQVRAFARHSPARSTPALSFNGAAESPAPLRHAWAVLAGDALALAEWGVPGAQALVCRMLASATPEQLEGADLLHAVSTRVSVEGGVAVEASRCVERALGGAGARLALRVDAVEGREGTLVGLVAGRGLRVVFSMSCTGSRAAFRVAARSLHAALRADSAMPPYRACMYHHPPGAYVPPATDWPAWARFAEVRRELDPLGRFAHAPLDAAMIALGCQT
jgi:hypothetical protein